MGGGEEELKGESHGLPYCSIRSYSRSAVRIISSSARSYTNSAYCSKFRLSIIQT